MARSFPQGFDSMAEYNGYLWCVKKLAVGDRVLLYLENNHTTCLKTRYTKEVVVIGKRSADQYLLGDKDNSIGFWKMNANLMPGELKETIPNFDEYPYGWWYDSLRDGRIAKIIKAK